jgi:hypothetical protein
MILAGLANNAAQPGGAQSILAALQQHDGSALQNAGSVIQNPQQSGAAGILGHVFGNQQGAANQAVAQHTGLDAAQVAQIMAVAAPLVMGAIGQMQRQQGLHAGNLGQVLGNEHQSAMQAAPGLLNIATQVLGGQGGGIGGLLGGLLGGGR